jgi:CheY-like chemotaxis protein
MPDGGEVIVSTRSVVLDASQLADTDIPPGRYVQVAIADRGAGMKPEVQARIFEPFFTTKDHGLGTGLGLCQVYGFARSAGGQVVVKSTVDRGTTVFLNLPPSAAPPVERGPSVRSHEPVAPAGLSVLVVEDDGDVLVATRDRVEELGYAVVTAKSGDEAYQMLTGGLSVDIVLSDIVMPGKLDGVQLARAIRCLRPDLKFVLTSGYTGGALERFHLPEGLLFLPKPYTQNDLAEKLVAAATG